MFQELQPLLPKEIGTLTLVLAILGTVLGAGLWLLGARYSRSLITLVLVSAGGWIGLFLPHWFGWHIDGWATAILSAIALGAGGFVMPRFWVGIGLGIMLSLAATIGFWRVYGDPGWMLPKIEVGATAVTYINATWQSLPASVRHALPFTTGVMLLVGLVAGLIWPRLSVVLLYSIVGVGLLATAGLWLLRFARPQWATSLPATKLSQAMTLAGLIALGAFVQWHLALSKRGPRPKLDKPVVVVQ